MITYIKTPDIKKKICSDFYFPPSQKELKPSQIKKDIPPIPRNKKIISPKKYSLSKKKFNKKSALPKNITK